MSAVPIQDFQANQHQSVREEKTFAWPLAERRWRTWRGVWLVWITGCAFWWCSGLLQSFYLLMACSVLVIQEWTSYCLNTGAWTAKLCVSDIVRGVLAEALTHRLRRFVRNARGDFHGSRKELGQQPKCCQAQRRRVFGPRQWNSWRRCPKHSWWACMRTSDIHRKLVSFDILSKTMQRFCKPDAPYFWTQCLPH